MSVRVVSSLSEAPAESCFCWYWVFYWMNFPWLFATAPHATFSSVVVADLPLCALLRRSCFEKLTMDSVNWVKHWSSVTAIKILKHALTVVGDWKTSWLFCNATATSTDKQWEKEWYTKTARLKLSNAIFLSERYLKTWNKLIWSLVHPVHVHKSINVEHWT